MPEGVKLSITYDTAKAALVFVLAPSQVETVIGLVRAAMKADKFKLEYQA